MPPSLTEKALYTVNKEALWTILRGYGWPQTLLASLEGECCASVAPKFVKIIKLF